MSDSTTCSVCTSIPRFIVLTGGPGAGKTAVLEIARRSLSARVAFLPEAASIIYGGGFLRRTSLPGKKAAQRAIFHVQREQERMIEDETIVHAALCDRGTIDGLAYWPGAEADYFREIGTTREAELARYHAVIHLRTPSATHGYNHQNPLRVEDAAEAQALDTRILDAWAGHPNRIVIESSADFLSKATAAIQAIKANLPDCCREHPVLFGP